LKSDAELNAAEKAELVRVTKKWADKVKKLEDDALEKRELEEFKRACATKEGDNE
jgi:hypothetical protein